jgi:hypothetical protein
VTADELRRLAVEYERILSRLMRLAATVEDAAARAEIERMIAEERARYLADAERVVLDWERAKQLPRANQSGTDRGMHAAARLRISKGASTKDKPTNTLVAAAHAAGYTLRSLAEKLGVSHSLLSLAHAGKESIGADLAKQVELLTGFAASKKNWPKLRA